WACAFHQDKASSVKVPVANVTISSSAHLLRENTDLFPLFATGISLGSVFLLELLEVALAEAYAFRAKEMPSLLSCQMASKVMTGVSDVDVLLGGILSTKNDTGYDKDRNNDENGGNDDEREINNVVEEEDEEHICFLGGHSSSRIKKYRGSNSNDGGNTRDGVKIAGEVIGSGGEIDENTGGIILSLKFSEELKELLPNETGK
ncbi:hypothetical protein Tco_1160311, partial [Tanacetum coccineum]